MSSNGWFRRKTIMPRQAAPNAGEIPEGLWTRCPKCHEILFTKELEKFLKVCKKCGHHFRLSIEERVEMLLDENSFVPFEDNLHTANPLKFPDYDTSVERWRKSSGEDESMLTGQGTIMGHPLYLGLAVFKFAGASMGAVYGERVVRILEAGLKDRIPVLMVCASGGARMHEGLLSLMQMAKTSAAVARYRDAGLPYLVLHTDPTTAGVLASFASLGDVILAEPGAMVGFAGPRVAQKVQVEKPPANFQTSEFQMDSGMIDMIVPRKELRTTLARILSFTGSQVSPTFPGHGNGTGHPEQISEIEIMDVS